MTSSDPSFGIPARPERTYSRGGGLEYEGAVVFELDPAAERTDGDLDALVRRVVEGGGYRWGDFLELPMPLYLVRDEGTGDVFRVSVRDGTVRLHVLPATGSAGLRQFYDRLVERSACDWRVHRHTDLDE